MDALDLYAVLRTHLRVVHHLPGRIRLKWNPPAQLPESVPAMSAHEAIQHLQAQATHIPGLLALRVNPMARSCVLEYSPDVIPMQAWEDWLSGQMTPAAQVLHQHWGSLVKTSTQD